MRLSPKSIFVGILAIGLPVAVATGWTLATPETRSTEASVPPGEGYLGTAPAPAVTPTPVSHTGYSSRPPFRPPVSTTTVIVTAAPSTVIVTAAPAATSPTPSATGAPATTSTPSPTLPILTQPPVPTPTEVTEPSGPPIPTESADPSESAPAQP